MSEVETRQVGPSFFLKLLLTVFPEQVTLDVHLHDYKGTESKLNTYRPRVRSRGPVDRGLRE